MGCDSTCKCDERERDRWTEAIEVLGFSVHPGLSIIENLACLIEGGALVERERWKAALRSVKCILPDDAEDVERAVTKSRGSGA